ncbi:hypothetical protein BDV09DRAFT_185479 [Aspergillus tetrazonus]
MEPQRDSLPTLRWGIIGAGLISSWFTKDITLPRKSPAAAHKIQAIGSSSLEKGRAFVETHLATLNPKPTVYSNYGDVYNDPEVDIVYIGTPHGLHKQHCLDAIAAGKHVLCEKAFTLNATEGREVLAAAQAKGVFIMEVMWTRFHPLVSKLKHVLFQEKEIGDVRHPAMGAGSLLDIGIYALTWGLLTLESDPAKSERPRVVAAQTLRDGVDIATSFILHYPSTGRQGILTSTTEARTPEIFMRIEGSNGYITVEGIAASAPRAFTVYPRRYDFELEGMGFYFEADAVAKSISQGKLENEVMSHSETVRVLEILDEIRTQGGARFPGDA